MNAPRRLIIHGAGGHGRVVAELAQASGWEVAGFMDPGITPGTRTNGLPLLETGMDYPGHAFFPAIGNGEIRWREYCALLAVGLPVATLTHPFTAVSPSVSLGKGTVVMAGCVIQANTWIGEAVILNTGAKIDHDCHIGDGTMIAPGAVLCGGVTIGSHAFIGAGTVITPGIRVGDGAFIGAGSVIVENIPAGAVHKPIRKTPHTIQGATS